MLESRPSRTALRVALRRAAHQLYDPPPLVFPDPIAVPILGQQYSEELAKTATKLHKPFSIALRAFLVARSRYAEDNLATLVGSLAPRPTQYVLLGAGLDTFAYRNPYANLRVFEVDHPSTQQWKRDLLHQNSILIPASLAFAPVDFEHEPLPTRLLASGFDPNIPTLFAWLGVVPYLTLPAFRATINFVARSAPGSGLVFDYAQPRSALPFLEQLAHDSLAARVALAGEPFQLFFTPTEVAVELSAFHRIEDLGTLEINAHYFSTCTDRLKTRGSVGRLISAWL